MKRVANAYVQALGQFAVWEVLCDGWKSLGTITKETVFVIASVLWMIAAPFLAVVEVFRPGTLDRLLFKLSR